MILHRLLLVALFSTILLVPATAQAQMGDEPGPVHKHLNEMAGKWDVDITYVINGQEHHGKANCEAKWILDGRFLRQEYESNMMGKPYSVIQHLGYDNQKKKIIEIKMDNMSTSMMHNEGTISEDGKTITNQGEIIDHSNGKPVKLRTVYTIMDPDHFKLEWFMLRADGKEEKGVSMTHTRKK